MSAPMMEAPSILQQGAGASFAASKRSAEVNWRPLYWIGGVAALLSVATIALAMVVYLAWPPPSTMAGWFALLQRNGFLGLLDLDLLLVVSYAAMIPLYLALYIALRAVNHSLMAIALALNLLGASLILAAHPGAAMLTLSGQYATATSEAQRSILAAAGQALIVNWSGSGFVVGYLFGAIATLLTATVMLRSGVFSDLTAGVGFVMGALMLVPASAGTVGLMLSLLSLAPTVVWLLLIARRLFQMSGARPIAGQSAHW